MTTEPAKPAPTAVSPGSSTSADIDAFLRVTREVGAVASGAPRLIFALDATMSRQPTWDMAAGVQGAMFEAVAATGRLAVQLVYFRGLGECRASRWVADPRALGALMTQIRCRSGNTQIARVLRHAATEAVRERVGALIYVGDAVEESADELAGIAGELGLLGVKAFMFHEGANPATVAGFGEIARITGGAALAFDARAPASLAALLAAVAAYAWGGRSALNRLAAHDPGARRLVAALPVGASP